MLANNIDLVHDRSESLVKFCLLMILLVLIRSVLNLIVHAYLSNPHDEQHIDENTVQNYFKACN